MSHRFSIMKETKKLVPAAEKPRQRMTAEQKEALNTLLRDARASTTNSRGAHFTRNDLHER